MCEHRTSEPSLCNTFNRPFRARTSGSGRQRPHAQHTVECVADADYESIGGRKGSARHAETSAGELNWNQTRTETKMKWGKTWKK